MTKFFQKRTGVNSGVENPTQPLGARQSLKRGYHEDAASGARAKYNWIYQGQRVDIFAAIGGRSWWPEVTGGNIGAGNGSESRGERRQGRSRLALLNAEV